MKAEETWREFDTLDGIDPRVKTKAFNEAKILYDALNRTIEVKAFLQDLVYHQQRMLEKWADGDDNVKNTLWKNLHDSGNKAKEYLTGSDLTLKE